MGMGTRNTGDAVRGGPEEKGTLSKLLILKEGENRESEVFRLNKGDLLHFVCSTELQDKRVRLFCDHPSKFGGLVRSREISWDCQSEAVLQRDVCEDLEKVSEAISIVQAGSFRYFFTVDNDSDDLSLASGQGYVLVDPELRVSLRHPPIPLDSVQCVTVLPKLMGPLSRWRGVLRVCHETGYNLVHYTPVQSLNSHSNSAYSLSDQHAINPCLAEPAEEKLGSSTTSCSSASSTPDQPTKGKVTFGDLEKVLQKAGDEWGMGCLTDLVLNHTGTDSQWLLVYPHSAYNLYNSPHLKPAYLLDRMLMTFSSDVAQGQLRQHDMGPEISSRNQLQAMSHHLQYIELPKIRFEEFYIVDVDRCVDAFKTALENTDLSLHFFSVRPDDYDFTDFTKNEETVEIVQDPLYRRYECTVDMSNALQVYGALYVRDQANEHRMTEVLRKFRSRLELLNHRKREEVGHHLTSAISNVMAAVQYRFLDAHGPRMGRVTSKKPLVEPYFTYKKQVYEVTMEQAERLLSDSNLCPYVMAHNGWVMNYDPLKNFAEKDSQVYLRRELVVWGDSIKLFYGEKPSDSPHLWNHMKTYSEMTARMFHGVRLDNCHNTPLHVAEFMLKAARAIRPDLYVVAELFTSSETIDNKFVNRLGINSLIRESLTAWDAHEQGRLVHRYGGQSVGSFSRPHIQVFKPSVAHALFMDMTHDNKSPIQERSVYDPLPTAAFVAMSCCAIGSSWGFDQLVPHHIDIVEEKRMYPEWTDALVDSAMHINGSTGIIAAKRILNNIHRDMGAQGFTEVYVHDLSRDTVAITRHHPTSHQSVICVARTAFSKGHYANRSTASIQPLSFEGVIDKVLLSCTLSRMADDESHTKDDFYINGLSQYTVSLLQGVDIQAVTGVQWLPRRGAEKNQYIEFKDFPPGSVLILRVRLYPGSQDALQNVAKVLEEVQSIQQTPVIEPITQGLQSVLQSLTLEDMNTILYHCHAEELSHTNFGVYKLDGHGEFTYAGFQGVTSVLRRVSESNDLGHPLCDNLRQGDWLPEYIVSRLAKYDGIKQFSSWLGHAFQPLADLPRYLIPKYFERIFTSVAGLLRACCLQKMNSVVSQTPLAKSLALSSLVFCGNISQAGLPPLCPSIQTEYCHPVTGLSSVVSIAAGLPHFAVGIMRNWGRDTFISLRGLLLVTGRHMEARAVILAYGGCLRHGLVPNLLGEGRSARYNCRDALWWWLQSVQDYCSMVARGEMILKDSVNRLYPQDDSVVEDGSIVEERSLEETIQESLQRHASGIAFRERNAGRSIDEQMNDQGFDVTAGIDWNTGFVYGGSTHNCGTWMDKMGSSEQAGTKGKPATPRNGSAVELVALCASAVRWLADMKAKGHYAYGSVKMGPSGTKVSFVDWHALIKKNFEEAFWIDGKFTNVDKDPHPEFVNRRDIYKDSVGSDPAWGDCQLRPNFPIAMVVASELFTPMKAWEALSVAGNLLMGPLGMKTLDPGDYNYHGDYVNSDDSADPKVSKGFNYHNGPEWLWPVGYFLRARLLFAQKLEASGEKVGVLQKTLTAIKRVLSNHHSALIHSDWFSLPELTNANGKVCADSCPAQAWSVGCLLDTVYDMHRIEHSN